MIELYCKIMKKNLQGRKSIAQQLKEMREETV